MTFSPPCLTALGGASTSRPVEISCFIGRYSKCPKDYSIQQHPRSDTSTGSLETPDAPRSLCMQGIRKNSMSVYVSQVMHCSPVLPVRLCHLVGRHQCCLTRATELLWAFRLYHICPYNSVYIEKYSDILKGCTSYFSGYPSPPHRRTLEFRRIR
ncbi:hypothetical protein NIES4073_53530 [Kalymmatonema gypsitolerans NIES-4073]|nr:hypothetical protein NIES4073_53530 [Scytonema sp. NIES-4073]